MFTLHLGCPIWSFKGWVGNFYPFGTNSTEFLREYTRRLTTVEGNTTFYAIPSKNTITSWASQMPPGFQFCPKIPRAISHEGTLAQRIENALAFVDIMEQLGTSLGPRFLQLPPPYSPKQLDDLQAFLNAWPAQLQLAVEVRHLDWFDTPHNEMLNEMLAQHKMARVTIDTRPIRNLKSDKILRGSAYESLLEARERKPNVPVIPERTADFIFIRYIGHPEMDFNIALLEEWAEYLTSQLSQGANAFFFCHSPDNMAAPYLCRELHRLIAERISIPPLPWEEADANRFEQGRLF